MFIVIYIAPFIEREVCFIINGGNHEKSPLGLNEYFKI